MPATRDFRSHSCGHCSPLGGMPRGKGGEVACPATRRAQFGMMAEGTNCRLFGLRPPLAGITSNPEGGGLDLLLRPLTNVLCLFRKYVGMKQAGRSPLMFLLGAKALACHAVYGE